MKKLVLTFLFLFETISAQSWSLHFPGTDGYVQIPSSSAFSFVSAMTIEAWVKVDAFDKDWQAIVTRGDNSWRLHRNAETNYIAFSTTNLSNVNLISTISINDGLWHHIAGVYNGSTKYLYIDGELNVSVSVTGTLATNTKVVQIGGNADYSDRRFRGNIDEVRIWNVARSQADIQANLYESLSGSETGLIAYYQMSNGWGISLMDDSGNEHYGTILFATWDDDYTSSFPLGSEPNPYKITSLSDIEWLMENELIWIGNYYFIQTADIDASATSGWNQNAGIIPIGTFTYPFNGHYDGQGYKIDGLYCNRPTISRNALFGAINNGTVKNLGVTNVNFSGKQFVNGLASYVENNSIIENCYTSGVVTSNDGYASGLIGYLDASIVRNCFSTVHVICTTYGKYFFAGFIAWVIDNSLIENCYSRGSVDADGNYKVGGFIGSILYTSVIIKNCYSTGHVTGRIYNYTTGGFIGSSDGVTIINSFWDIGESGLSTSYGGTGKTTYQMKHVETFTDYTDGSDGLTQPVWDFETNPYDDEGNNNFWDIDPSWDINNGYPFLSWQNGTEIALSVELTSFTATNSTDHITLNWQTATEQNNYGFEIQRSVVSDKSSEFEKIGFVEGHGNSNSPKNYSFVDASTPCLLAGTALSISSISYRLKQIDIDGSFEYSENVSVETNNDVFLPTKFELFQNYPNPFNPMTTIKYSILSYEYVSLKIYDTLGNEIATLVNGQKEPGNYNLNFDASNFASGVYIYRLKAGNFNSVKKLIIVK